MTTTSLSKKATYCWEDYQNWDDDQRWELINGDAYSMSPSPTTQHQRLSLALLLRLGSYFAEHACELFHAPMDVKLSDSDVVQPDIFVVCNLDQIKKNYIEGPPTLVVEILSPSSLQHDRLRKTELYSKFGVKEYWLVTPYPSLVEILLLDGDNYRIHRVHQRSDQLVSPTFSDLHLHLSDLFNLPIPTEEKVKEIQEATPPYKS